MEDFYCDGDAAPLGRMNFVYQNYIPGVTEVKYPWETDAPTEVPTDPATDAPTDVPDTAPDTNTVTEDETDNGSGSLLGGLGCSGTVASACIASVAAALSAAYVLRKRRS